MPRAKTRGFATVDDLSTIRLPARRVRLQRRPCVAACGEKPVLMETAGLVPRVFRLLALDHGLVFTTYSKTARREGPESARDAFRGPIGVPCVTPPSRRPSATKPSAHSSGREKKLRGAGGAAVGRVPRPRLRAGDAGATLLVDARAGATRGRACPMRAHFHGATTKRGRRSRAGDDARATRASFVVVVGEAEASSPLKARRGAVIPRTRRLSRISGLAKVGRAGDAAGSSSARHLSRCRRRRSAVVGGNRRPC